MADDSITIACAATKTCELHDFVEALEMTPSEPYDSFVESSPLYMLNIALGGPKDLLPWQMGSIFKSFSNVLSFDQVSELDMSHITDISRKMNEFDWLEPLLNDERSDIRERAAKVLYRSNEAPPKLLPTILKRYQLETGVTIKPWLLEIIERYGMDAKCILPTLLKELNEGKVDASMLLIAMCKVAPNDSRVLSELKKRSNLIFENVDNGRKVSYVSEHNYQLVRAITECGKGGYALLKRLALSSDKYAEVICTALNSSMSDGNEQFLLDLLKAPGRALKMHVMETLVTYFIWDDKEETGNVLHILEDRIYPGAHRRVTAIANALLDNVTALYYVQSYNEPLLWKISRWFDYNEQNISTDVFHRLLQMLSNGDPRVWGSALNIVSSINDYRYLYYTKAIEMVRAPKRKWVREFAFRVIGGEPVILTQLFQEELFKVRCDKELLSAIINAMEGRQLSEPSEELNNVLPLLDEAIKRYPEVKIEAERLANMILDKIW